MKKWLNYVKLITYGMHIFVLRAFNASANELKDLTYSVETNEKATNYISNYAASKRSIAFCKYEDLPQFKKEIVKMILESNGVSLDFVSSQVNAMSMEQIAKMLNIPVEALLAAIDIMENSAKQNINEQEK